MLIALLKTMRPRQWSKNVFIFAALVFDKQLLHADAFLQTLAGFALFCLISSAVYIFNDLADVEADREHPEKKHRPIASGKLPVSAAWISGIVLVVITLGLGYFLTAGFLAVFIVFFFFFIVFFKLLKNISILDVFVFGSGFFFSVPSGVTFIF